MRKINKRSIFSSVLALMLVFSVGFYSTLSPTTAWLTDSNVADKQFLMDQITFDGPANTDINLRFLASTDVFDAEERSNMFDDAVKFVFLTAHNTGDIDADLTVNVFDYDTSDGTQYKNMGLHYFFFEYAPNLAETPTYAQSAVNEVASDVYEDSSGNRVVKDGGEYYISTPLVDKLEEELDAFPGLTSSSTDATKAEFFNACENREIRVNAGESKRICVAFWVQYDEYTNSSNNPVINELRTAEFDIKLDISGTQLKEYNSVTAAANP